MHKDRLILRRQLRPREEAVMHTETVRGSQDLEVVGVRIACRVADALTLHFRRNPPVGWLHFSVVAIPGTLHVGRTRQYAVEISTPARAGEPVPPENQIEVPYRLQGENMDVPLQDCIGAAVNAWIREGPYAVTVMFPGTTSALAAFTGAFRAG